MTELKKCRLCGNENLITVLDLGNQALCGRFPKNNTENVPIYPLILVKCMPTNFEKVCGLVQLKQSVNQDELYHHNYGYRSGINTTMTAHLENLTREIENIVSINDDDYIVDIGSNDCTLLKSYKKGNKIGIDPTGEQFKSFYPKNIILIPDYFDDTKYIYGVIEHIALTTNNTTNPTTNTTNNTTNTTNHTTNTTNNNPNHNTNNPNNTTLKNLAVISSQIRAKVVTSISMFYDLPNPLEFSQQVANILHNDGIWVMEQSYLPTMLESNSFDSVCHEHLEYYSLKQIKYIAEHVGLKILRVSLNSCNGGSFRVTLVHSTFNMTIEEIENVKLFELKENTLGLDDLKTYSLFRESFEKEKQICMNFIIEQHHRGKKIGIYGASTKGNTLLQYYGINDKLICGASERNVEKYGCFTPSTNIPIISESEMRDLKPDFLLVLPWHFKEEFLKRESEYMNQGGQFIFPLPHFSLVSNRKKIFVTGLDGQLGNYLYDKIKKNGNAKIYATIRGVKSMLKEVTYFNIDLSTDKGMTRLRKVLEFLKPDEIYHLASPAIAPIATFNESFFLNYNVTEILCEYVSKDKSRRLVVCNSSEIYKGIKNSAINENNMNTLYPNSPYGLSKASSYLLCRYYREILGAHVSSAIIFNSESPLRRKEYVSQKIINGVKNGKIVGLGNLDIKRGWLHSFDVANALIIIQKSETPSDYCVCSNNLHSIRDFIIEAFKQYSDITLIWNDTGAIDQNCIQRCTYDLSKKENYQSEQITVGDNKPLFDKGWKIKYSFEDIISDMY